MLGVSFKAGPIALLLGLAVVLQAPAHQQASADSDSHRDSSRGLHFVYKFENPKFYISLIEVRVETDATGLVRFKRSISDDLIERPLKLSARTHRRLNELTERLNLLTTDEEFQHKKDFSHLGWTTISVHQGDHERTFRFNYTINADMSELAEILRALATQAIDLFDIDLAQEHQPLDIPRLLEALENDLRLGRIADPDQLADLLRAMMNDDTLPLIARNHASRLIKAISKGAYKSPIRGGKDN